MLKKKLVLILCALANVNSISADQPAHTVAVPEKIQTLYHLSDLVEKLNRVKPIGQYLFAVPNFIELTGQDVKNFLAAIPSGFDDPNSRKKQPLSMLGFIQNKWTKVVEQAKIHKKCTPLMREYLIEIREAIEHAFRHDLLNAPLRQEVRSFLERQKEQDNELIVRVAPTSTLQSVKSVQPYSAHSIHKGIARALLAFFSEQRVCEQLKDSLPLDFDLPLILQSSIKEDIEQAFIVSGVACSYDNLSSIPHVVTITANFGDTKGVRKPNITTDTYFVHDTIIYPVIRKKQNRVIADTKTARSYLNANPESVRLQPTLNAQAVYELARAVKTIEEIYQAPICMTFIKRDNTIYILNVETPDFSKNIKPSFYDPLYTNALSVDKKIEIEPITPDARVVVIKKREKIILAPNVRTFISLLNKRDKPHEVLIAIIKRKPGTYSKEAKLLTGIDIPIVWTSDFDKLRSWIDENRYPLVFDIQQKIAFQFVRTRGFCTLFQGIHGGIYTHPLKPEISVLPDFMIPINSDERSKLKPDEHFSGVSLERLFDLIKTGSPATADSALNTLLFRMQKHIIGEYITRKECSGASKQPHTNICEQMEQMYAYIERVAYQLKTLFKRLEHTSHTDALEKIFLIHILQAVVMQEHNPEIAATKSFMQLANKPQEH